MTFSWTSTPDLHMLDLMEAFYHEQKMVHIQQYPQWNVLEDPNRKYRYCIAFEEEKIVGYVVITDNAVESRIFFGPLAVDNEVRAMIINAVVSYYKSKPLSLSLSILLGMENSSDSAVLLYSIYKKNKFHLAFDPRNKSTLMIRLDKNDEELLRSFSKHHIYLVKRAIKDKLVTRVLTEQEEIHSFAEGCCTMYASRGIRKDAARESRGFKQIQDWFGKKKQGFYLGVFDESGQMLGGTLVVLQNKRAEYYMGYVLPEKRKFPVNYLALYVSMKIARDAGMEYFDMGGYNHMVSEKDQVFQIGIFKKGFGGDDFTYPMVMYFDLKPMGTRLVNMIRKTKKILRPGN